MSLPSFDSSASTAPQPYTVLTARFWPDKHGGVETSMWNMSRELAQRGCDVTVLTENREGRLPTDEHVMPGLYVHRAPPLKPGRFWRWLPLVRLRWWQRALAQAPAQGAIWASEPICAVAAILCGMRDRLIYNPAACTAGMRQIGKLYRHIDTMRPARLVIWLDRFAYRSAKRVVLSSENLRAQFEQHFGKHPHVQVIPLAANPIEKPLSQAAARRKFNLDEDAFVLGFVGRLDPCKGLDFLFEAMTHAGPDSRTHLLIVGDGPDRQRLQDRAAAAGLSQRIVWAGALLQPAAAYAAMDVLVMPSLYEAFGLAVLEAMAAGLPVLGRRGNGRTVLTAMEEIIEHGVTGYCFDAHDDGDLAHYIALLRDGQSDRQRMASAARRYASHRHWQRYVQTCFDRVFIGPPPGDTITRPRQMAA